MRLRNIKRAEGTIGTHRAAINEPKIQRGNWSVVFGNKNPLYIEIGMGKGQFLLTMALHNPNVNYVGIERYSSVLLRALERFDSEQYKTLNNIKFICMDARELGEVFTAGEVGRIYLNFSDPWPKARHAKRRLTSKEFFACYNQVLAEGGEVEFKTDNSILFQFSLEQVEAAGWKLVNHTYDLHHEAGMVKGNVMTEYEVKFSSMGHPIHKLIATRT